MNGIFILLAYAVIMVDATVLFTKKSTGSDFHVGDRKMSTLPAAMSIAATWIWAPALFTSAEKAYSNGIPGLFWFLIPNVLCLILFVPFAKKIRQRMPHGLTLSGFMGETYGSAKVKGIYGIQLAGLTILSTAVQLLAGGHVLSTATGIPFTAVTIILAIVAFSYAQFSGIKASVLTDAIQMVFLLIACVIFVPWALRMPGGLESLKTGLSGFSGEYAHIFDEKGYQVFLAFGLPTAIGLISGPFGDQCFWQRAFSIDQKKIGKAFILGALMFAVIPLSMGILGFIAAGSGFRATDTGIVNFELILHLFPDWVILPFLFMLISGLLSTVDSNLCAIASLTTDWEATDKRYAPRLSMAILLILGVLIANIPGLTVTHMFLIYGSLRATTLMNTVMTLCDIKLSGKGIVCGIAASMLTGVPAFAYATINNLALLKSITSLYTVLSAGIISLLISRIGGMKCRKC